jgi:DNA repair photolyase
MKRFTGHREAWGTFVDVKQNAVSLLQRELRRKKPGRVWLSGTCDPYQPIEEQTNITRECLRLLTQLRWPVTIQTKSPLILRDLDILEFEPHAPSIQNRLQALTALHTTGIPTSAMIAPLLPHSEELLPQLQNIVDYIIIDKMNYKNLNKSYLGYQLRDDCIICHKRIQTHDVHVWYSS